MVRGSEVVAADGFFGEDFEPTPSTLRRRAGEERFDDFRVKADGFEDLRRLVDCSVEMPILDMTLSKPLSTALM